MHLAITPFNSIDSRTISATPAPKIRIVPTRFPRIISPFRQNGNATSHPASGGSVNIRAIQGQLSSVTCASAKVLAEELHKTSVQGSSTIGVGDVNTMRAHRLHLTPARRLPCAHFLGGSLRACCSRA